MKKEVNDKVYALMLEGEDLKYMSLQYASSLEEAYTLAKLEFEKDNPKMTGINNPLLASKIGLFTIKTINKLLVTNRDLSEIKINKRIKKIDIEELEETKNFKKIATIVKKKITKKEEKNKLIEEIIKKKDLKVLEKSKDLLTLNEYKYVMSQIK